MNRRRYPCRLGLMIATRPRGAPALGARAYVRSRSSAQSPARKRAHACGRVSAAILGLGLPGGGPDRSRDGLLGQLPPGTDPPTADGGAAARDREIRALLEMALRKLEEGRP
jgi:hypothetical protein